MITLMQDLPEQERQALAELINQCAGESPVRALAADQRTTMVVSARG